MDERNYPKEFYDQWINPLMSMVPKNSSQHHEILNGDFTSLRRYPTLGDFEPHPTAFIGYRWPLFFALGTESRRGVGIAGLDSRGRPTIGFGRIEGQRLYQPIYVVDADGNFRIYNVEKASKSVQSFDNTHRNAYHFLCLHYSWWGRRKIVRLKPPGKTLPPLFWRRTDFYFGYDARILLHGSWTTVWFKHVVHGGVDAIRPVAMHDSLYDVSRVRAAVQRQEDWALREWGKFRSQVSAPCRVAYRPVATPTTYDGTERGDRITKSATNMIGHLVRYRYERPTEAMHDQLD